jgi:F1F0 ATPase subunit 2
MTLQVLPLAAAFIAGLALGLVYFGGLWLTVRQLAAGRWPVPAAFASLALRTAAAIAGFWYVMDGSWQRLLACLAGFMLVRLVMVSRMRAADRAARTDLP